MTEGTSVSLGFQRGHLLPWMLGVLLLAPAHGQPPSAVSTGAWFTEPAGAEVGDLPRRLSDLLDQAVRSVDLAMIRMDCPEVLTALERAHGRGVTVRVLTDDDSRHDKWRLTWQRLTDCGILVRTDRRQPLNANWHHKFCVVDGRWVFAGDWNPTRADTEDASHSAYLVASVPLAEAFLQEFDRFWRGDPVGVVTGFGGVPVPCSLEGGGEARVWFASRAHLDDVVAQAIAGAKSRVDVAHVFFGNRRVLMAVLQAAARGVRVRVGSEFVADVPRVRDELARFGIPLHLGIGTKIILVDDAVITGSWNCNDDLDHENLVQFSGTPVVDAYQRGVQGLFRGKPEPFFSATPEAVPPEAGEGRFASRVGPVPGPLAEGELQAELEIRFADSDLAITPLWSRWRNDQVWQGTSRSVIAFQKRADSVGLEQRVRFVVSTGRLHGSYGNALDPHNPPLELGERDFPEGQTTVAWPLDVSLTESGSWRVDLDAFVPQGAAWRWVGSWRVPPSVRHRMPHVRLDDPTPRASHFETDEGFSSWTLTRAERFSGGIRSVGRGAACALGGIALQGWEAAILEVSVTTTAVPDLRVRFDRRERGTMDAEQTVVIPLLPDGLPHTYTVDLGAVPFWLGAEPIRRLWVDLGSDGQPLELHRFRFVGPARLGPESVGTFVDGTGQSVAVMWVDGTDGGTSQRVWTAPGRRMELVLHSPDPAGRPVPFVLFAHRGVPDRPSPSLEEFGVPGRMSFLPHLLPPGNERSMTVADAARLDPSAHLQAPPAPTRILVPVPAFPSGTELVLQPVFLSPCPGVGNAVTVIIQ